MDRDPYRRLNPRSTRLHRGASSRNGFAWSKPIERWRWRRGLRRAGSRAPRSRGQVKVTDCAPAAASRDGIAAWAARIRWIAGRTFLMARDAGEGTEASVSRDTAEIGVFGGSGFYSLLDDVREVKVDTPYGPPSDSIFLADVAGRRVAFLPRHGRRHTIPPHRINYRANVWAMRSLGREGGHLAVRRRLAPARGQARRLRRVRPVRRPDERPRRHLLRRPDRDPPLVGRDLRPGPARARDRRPSATTASRSTSAARSSSSRGRASRRRPSRSGSATPAGRSST